MYELSNIYFFSVFQSHKYVNSTKVHLYPFLFLSFPITISLCLSLSVFLSFYLCVCVSLWFIRQCRMMNFSKTFFLSPISRIWKLQVKSTLKNFPALPLKYCDLVFSGCKSRYCGKWLRSFWLHIFISLNTKFIEKSNFFYWNV